MIRGNMLIRSKRFSYSGTGAPLLVLVSLLAFFFYLDSLAGITLVVAIS